MTIIKTKTLVETYRAKASSKDINDLTGRTGRPELTKFIINQMALKLPIETSTILVDIGCGDGSFLLKAADNGLDGYQGRLIGILPTTEEIIRVHNHLLLKSNTKQHPISIEIGLAKQTKMPNNFCDILVCNSVLHGGGQTLQDIKQALAEFNRITKVKGTIFIGEMPDSNEMAGKNYGNSITSWLLWVLRNQGLKQFWARLKQTMLAIFSKQPFIIAPKNMFYMPPNQFIALLKEYGIEVVAHYRHKEIDSDGNAYESKTRWDYVCIKR